MTNDPKRDGGMSLLRTLFFPATWVLARLKFLPKFALMGLLLLIPLIFVAYLQYSGTSEDVDFNEAEHDGMVYLDPLKDYINAQQRHWVAAVGVAAGAEGASTVQAAVAGELARLEKAVDVVDKQYNGLLRTSVRWAEAKAAWAQAVGTDPRNIADLNTAHANAVGITADLILNYVANNSNLILDPDLDSYWLMDTAMIKGPLLGTQLAQQATSAMVPVTERTGYVLTVASPMSLLTSTLADTENVNLKTAIETTPRFGNSKTMERNLRGPFDALKGQSLALIDLLKGRYLAQQFTSAAATVGPDGTPIPAPAPAKANPTELAQGTIKALESLDVFYDAVMPELDALILKRVDNYKGSRTQGLVLTGIGIFLLLFVFAGFYMSMSQLVTSLGDASNRMIKGTEETFTTENKDETANIVTNFNEINRALVESRDLQRRVSAENAETQQHIVDLLKVVSDASDGDLTTRAPMTSGSLGNVSDAFNLLMESLEELIGDVSKQVAASEQAVASISDVAKRMSSGATAQAREIANTRTLVADVASQINDVSANAENAMTASTHTATTAQAGEKAVDDVIDGMESLRANVQAGAKKMKNLGDRSMEITSIVETITRISEQTNMLALNAAIEAARAGEHGRGFRVVADEVRKLAERASTATKDIDKLVKAINAETNETIKAIEQQTQVVEVESKTVTVAGDSLRAIRSASEQSAGLVAQITDVAKRQVEYTSRVATSMESVSATAAEAERGAAKTVETVAHLVVLSNTLRTAIGKFRVSSGAR